MPKLAEDLAAASKDGLICDIKLKGIEDGVEVQASRFLLSARSRVFRKMLFEDSTFSNDSVVPVDYTSSTIESIVHYCYTDEVLAQLESCSEEKVREMVRLRCAANVFELEDLGEQVVKIISKHLAEYPSLACVVVDEDEATGKGASDNGLLSEIALGIIAIRAEDALLPEDPSFEGGVLALKNATALEKVLQSDLVTADNFVKYRSLQRWCGEISVYGGTEEGQEERIEIAKNIANTLDFSEIKASDLADMTTSKLVTKDQLIDAFKAHALSAEEEAHELRKPPKKGGCVLVTGAGVAEINGKYQEDGKCDGAMQYSKVGLWDGESGKYLLYRAKGNTKKRYWFLDWEEINLFVAELDEGGMEGIPHSTWKSNNVNSVPPMPRVLFVPPHRGGDWSQGLPLGPSRSFRG